MKGALKQEYAARLSQADILEAVRLLLVARGELPENAYVVFRHRFGLVGDPMITLVGDATELPNAGDVYLDWGFEPLPNVKGIR